MFCYFILRTRTILMHLIGLFGTFKGIRPQGTFLFCEVCMALKLVIQGWWVCEGLPDVACHAQLLLAARLLRIRAAKFTMRDQWRGGVNEWVKWYPSCWQTCQRPSRLHINFLAYWKRMNVPSDPKHRRQISTANLLDIVDSCPEWYRVQQ